MDDRTRERRDAHPATTAQSNGGRKRYRRPVLTEYGAIAKLTQGTLTTASDGPGNTMRKSCL